MQKANVYAPSHATRNEINLWNFGLAMEAHYDSVPYGPGAADDCRGVGVTLELARILKQGPPLKNDIIMCFSDSEEINAGDARAFAGSFSVPLSGAALPAEYGRG